MSSDDGQIDGIEPPQLSNHLLSSLSVKQDEYENQFSSAMGDEERMIEAALDRLRAHASSLLTTAVLTPELETALAEFRPGTPLMAKVRDLLGYPVVHHRMEFSVAEDVCGRLAGVERRVQQVVILTMILMGYAPSQTAIKYFERATRLFLAGYQAETVIMCGAVLEAALAARFPNSELAAHGVRPTYSKAKDYSVGQRLIFERSHSVLTEAQRTMAADLVNWRNDAVHVQPDLAPHPQEALLNLVVLLGRLLPGRPPT